MKRVLVTGAAGFLGQHIVAKLLEQDCEVIGVDLVPQQDAHLLRAHLEEPGFAYRCGPLDDILSKAMVGVSEVWHLAANTDIPLSGRDTSVDLQDSAMLTQRVLEHMRTNGVNSLVFPSSGAVYGENPRLPFSEQTGPLLPCSLYGAGKAAAEALISAYSHLFSLRATILRLGNVVGDGMARGIVLDFVRKLKDNPTTLAVRGDGSQRKAFVSATDVVEGMLHVARLEERQRLEVVNIASSSSLRVGQVAAEVAAALGQPAPRLTFEDQARSWPGDQPVVELDVRYAERLGWREALSPEEAVRQAAAYLARR